MKKVIVIGIVLAMVMCVAGTASASYLWGAAASSDANYSLYGAAVNFGEFSPTGTAVQSWPTSNYAYTALVAGGEWEASTKTLYKKEFVAAAPAEWVFEVWTGAGYVSDMVAFRLYGSAAGLDPTPMMLYVISDPTETYAAGHVLATNIVATAGTAASPTLLLELPAFKTATPELAGNGIILGFKAVPEPGSMVAMLSGLVGLVGFGIRRRK